MRSKLEECIEITQMLEQLNSLKNSLKEKEIVLTDDDYKKILELMETLKNFPESMTTYENNLKK